jgi:hypothetical protein
MPLRSRSASVVGSSKHHRDRREAPHRNGPRCPSPNPTPMTPAESSSWFTRRRSEAHRPAQPMDAKTRSSWTAGTRDAVAARVASALPARRPSRARGDSPSNVTRFHRTPGSGRGRARRRDGGPRALRRAARVCLPAPSLGFAARARSAGAAPAHARLRGGLANVSPWSVGHRLRLLREPAAGTFVRPPPRRARPAPKASRRSPSSCSPSREEQGSEATACERSVCCLLNSVASYGATSASDC